jgi:hypothetical protein
MLPLAVEHYNVRKDELGAYNTRLSDKLRELPQKVSKLIPNLHDKQNYIVYDQNLKFYLEQGLVLTRIHRIVSFKQQAWVKPFIDRNMALRKQAKSTFESNLYKAMNNHTYGRFLLRADLQKNIELSVDNASFMKYSSRNDIENIKVADCVKPL